MNSKLKNHSFISQVFMLILGLINLKIIIEIFGIEQYGVINLYLSILLLFNSIFGFRVWESGIFALNQSIKENGNPRAIFYYFFKLELIVNIVLALLFLIILYGYNSIYENQYDIYILSLLLIVNISKDLSSQILVTLDDLKPYYYIRIIQPLMLLIFIISLTFYSNDLLVNDYFMMYILSIFSMTLVSFYYAYSKKLKNYKSENYKPSFNVLAFNKTSYLSSTARSFWERTDYLWINFLGTTEILGIYALAKKLVDYISLVVFTYWNSIKPSFTKNFDSLKGLDLILKYQKNILLLFVLIVLIVVTFNEIVVDFFNITNTKYFFIMLGTLIIVNLFWSFVIMSRYVITLFDKMEYSLNLNLILAFLLNGSILTMYYLLDFKNFEIVLISQSLVALFAYFFWMKKINYIYKGLSVK